MLLPALSKARHKARQISCTNNMKQLGTYAAFYSDDCGGYVLPTRQVPTGSWCDYYPALLYRLENLWSPYA